MKYDSQFGLLKILATSDDGVHHQKWDHGITASLRQECPTGMGEARMLGMTGIWMHLTTQDALHGQMLLHLHGNLALAKTRRRQAGSLLAL